MRKLTIFGNNNIFKVVVREKREQEMKAYVASHLKEMNRQKVYQLIRNTSATSKAEITKLTGISAPTVIKIVNFLEENDLIEEIGEIETAIGRRPHMLRLNESCMYAMSFLLEGDYLSMGIVNIADEVIYKKVIQITGPYRHIMDKIENEYVDQLIEESGIAREKLFGIGIALPVIFNKKKQRISGGPLISEAEFLDVQEDIDKLETKYHVMVMIENDTNAQTIGEFQKRSGSRQNDLVFISSGTGLGAGIIFDGKLRRGSNFMCGEIGYMALEENHHSNLKALGWMEEKVSYRKIIKDFGADITDASVELTEEQKHEIIEFLAKPLSLAIHNINTCLDCENVVLGGKSVEVLGQELVDKINEYLSRLSINHVDVKIQSSEDVGLVGMAWLLTNKKIKNILSSDIE